MYEGYVFNGDGTGSCFTQHNNTGDKTTIGTFQWAVAGNDELNLTNMVWIPSAEEKNKVREFTYSLSPDETKLTVSWTGVGLSQSFSSKAP